MKLILTTLLAFSLQTVTNASYSPQKYPELEKALRMQSNNAVKGHKECKNQCDDCENDACSKSCENEDCKKESCVGENNNEDVGESMR